MREAGLGDLDALGDHIISTSRRTMQAAIGRLPSGVFENSMTVDGYDRPITLQARMEIHPDRITVDYAGTSGTSAFGSMFRLPTPAPIRHSAFTASSAAAFPTMQDHWPPSR